MYLYGASGHAKVVMDILKANGIEITELIDDNPSIDKIAGVPVVHNAIGRSPVIVTIGDCHVRKKIVEKLNCDFIKAIHPSAIISDSATIGNGTVVMQGAIIQADAIIGEHCIINTRSSIDHECIIHDFVHIAPGVTISGNVEVGECTWIGIGSCIKQGVKIGKNCIIGAGSVVIKDIPDNSVAYGCPCKVIRINETK